MTAPDPQRLIAFANRLANASGGVIRPYFRAGIGVDIKGDGSPVTKADREAEAVIRALIAQEFPDHGVWGEEHGSGGESGSGTVGITPQRGVPRKHVTLTSG